MAYKTYNRMNQIGQPPWCPWWRRPNNQMGQTEYKTELPEEGYTPPVEPERKFVTLKIGGKTYTNVSTAISPDDYDAAKKAVQVFIQSGKNLEAWREYMLYLRDYAFIKWPEYYQSKIVPNIRKYSPELAETYINMNQRIQDLYNKGAEQYGEAQKNYDELLPYVNKIAQELTEQGLMGLGNPAIVLLIVIAIVAVSAAVVTTEYIHLQATKEVTKQTQMLFNTVEQLSKAPTEISTNVKESFKVLAENLPKTINQSQQEILTNSFNKTLDGHMESLNTAEDVIVQAPKILDSGKGVIEETRKAQQEKSPWAWVPLALLGVMGIMIAPAIKDFISGYAPKKEKP